MNVSVIVPVYNVKAYVEKCLDSLKRQTLESMEVIVVDDGSTDGSGELVDALCAGDDRFRVFHKENGGLMSAWTYGVRQSTGAYIGFVDSDDYVAEDMFQVLYQTATKHDVDLVQCDYTNVKDGHLTREASHSAPLAEGLYVGEAMNEIRKRALPNPDFESLSMARWNKLFRSSVLMENLKYCACLSRTFEDRYIVPECLFSARSYYYLRRSFYFYVKREGSISGMYKENLLSDIQRMYGVLRQAMEDKGLLDIYKRLYETAYLDYIRLYVNRNIVGVKGWSQKYHSARELLHDALTKERMDQYGKYLNGRQGSCVKLAFQFNMPSLLAIGSYFA